MYRILAADHEVRERRNQLRHPRYAAPELLARAPKELWSWDITKLLGPTKWTYFYLYVMLDVFSRYVVGWMVAPRESAGSAERFIHETCVRQGIRRGQLTIHADRGPAMTSKPVALLRSRPLTFIMGGRISASPHEPPYSPRPMPRIRDASPPADRPRRSLLPRYGSIRPKARCPHRRHRPLPASRLITLRPSPSLWSSQREGGQGEVDGAPGKAREG
jgi:transposase InsO family protein